MSTIYGTARYNPVGQRSYIHPSDTNPPTLPWLVPDTDYFVPVGGTLWDCPDTATLTAAFANALDGDRIKVYAGTTYNLTNIKLPQHSNWVYVFVASKLAGTFPLASSVYHPNGTKTQGARVTQAHSVATLGASSPLAQFVLGVNSVDPIFSTNVGGGGFWWFEGIEFMLDPTSTQGPSVGLLELGTGRDALDGIVIPTACKDIPNHFNFGHCLFHGNRTGATTFSNGPRRGISCNAGFVGVRDSYFYYIQLDGAESSGIGGWSCPGAFSSINNFISAAAQSILFGGAPPFVAGLVAKNFTTKWNHLWKDIRWFRSQGQTASYSCKNHYEHKDGSVALIEDVVMEHNATDGQDGTNILMQNLSDSAINPPTNKINDITFHTIKVFGGGPLMACTGAGQGAGSGGPVLPSAFSEQPGSRWLVSNIIGDQICGVLPEVGGGSHHGMLLDGSIRDLVIEHATFEAVTESFLLAPVTNFGDDDAATRLTVRNNITGYNGDETIFFASGGAVGTACLDANVQGYTVSRNVFYPHINGAANPANNPANNAYPTDIPSVGFASYAAASPSGLSAGSAYHNFSTDGTDPGADFTGIAAMETAVKSTTLPS